MCALWAAIVWRECAAPAREAEVGFIVAFGFAPTTGGALSHIDGMGDTDFIALAEKLRKKYGPTYRAPKLLKDMAENGETFYTRFDPYAEMDEAA